MNTFKFPQAFTRRVTKEYPNNKTLHSLLKARDLDKAGKILARYCTWTTNEQMMHDLRRGQLVKVVARFQREVERKAIFAEWAIVIKTRTKLRNKK